MKRFLWVSAYILGWAMLAGGVLLGGVWLHFYPSRGSAALYLTSVVQFALIPALMAIAIFAALRRWFMLVIALAVSGVLAYTQIPLVIPASAPQGQEFTVVSANLLFGGGDIGVLEKIVAEADPDLVSLQEVTPEALERIRGSEIARRLPNEFAIPYPQAAGTALFTRQPLSEQFNIPRHHPPQSPGAHRSTGCARHAGPRHPPGRTAVGGREGRLVPRHGHPGRPLRETAHGGAGSRDR